MDEFMQTKNNSQISALLIEDDCLNAMAAIPDSSVNLILCDLPYGTTQNAWDSVISLEALWLHYRRVLAPRGVVALMGQGPFTARLIFSQEEIFKYKITWIKSKSTNFLNAKKQPLRRHEDICIFYPRQPKYYPQMSPGEAYDKGVRKNQLTGSYGDFSPVRVQSEGGRYPTDVIYFKTAESEGPVWHPTQKPVELGRNIVRTYTDPGDMVLDNAFGSGSFLVSAALEGRSCVGIERNKDVHAFKHDPVDFIEVAENRLREFAPSVPCAVVRKNEIRGLVWRVSQFMEQVSRDNSVNQSIVKRNAPFASRSTTTGLR